MGAKKTAAAADPIAASEAETIGAEQSAPIVSAESSRAFCQQKLHAVDFTAPEGGVSEGRFYRIGGVVLFAAVSADEGRRFQAVTAGLFNHAPGVASGEFAEGLPLAFDSDAGQFVSASDAKRPVAFVGEGGKSLHLTGQLG